MVEVELEERRMQSEMESRRQKFIAGEREFQLKMYNFQSDYFIFE